MKSIFTFLLLFPLSFLLAQTPHDLIPRELLFKEKDKTKVQLSKDGESVFYKKNESEVSNVLFYVSGNSPLAERKKIFDGEVLDFRPVYDNGIVALIKKDTNLHLYFTTLKSQKIKQLEIFPLENLKFIHLSARFPNKILVNLTAKEKTKSGIYLLDLLSNSKKRMGKMNGFRQLFFDQNFSKVTALKRNELGGNTLLRFHEGSWKTVFEYPFHPEMFIGGLSKIISVSIDGKTIYATDNFEKDKTTFVAIDRETGEVTELASDSDADIIPYSASIDANGKPSSVVALWGDTRRHIVDESARKDFDFLNEKLNHSVSFVSASKDDKTWLVRKLNGGPMVYYHYKRSEQTLTKLFNDFFHLDDYDMASRKAYTVTTRDEMNLPVHVYLPPGMAKSDGMPKVPLPTIIYIHGGPWAGVTHWNGWFHTRNFQLLANRGYAVIHMEFRGTTGLGKKACDAGNLQWGASMHQDIVDVVTWANRSKISNPKRVAMWGWSYGGYATNFALAAAPDLFACGVSMYGIPDLYKFASIDFTDNELWRNRVGNPHTEEGIALLKSHSPTTYLESINSPILLTTGSKDQRVPQSHIDDFANKLDEAGKEVVYFYYPEEGHDYRRPESWVSFWAIAEDFLHKHVGGRKELKKEDIEKGNFTTVFGAGYIEDIE